MCATSPNRTSLCLCSSSLECFFPCLSQILPCDDSFWSSLDLVWKTLLGCSSSWSWLPTVIVLVGALWLDYNAHFLVSPLTSNLSSLILLKISSALLSSIYFDKLIKWIVTLPRLSHLLLYCKGFVLCLHQEFIIFVGGECLTLNIPCTNPLLQVKPV